MKATSFIIAGALVLQVSSLLAFNSLPGTNENKDANASLSASLIPITPTEATFDDVTLSYDIASLAPVTPAEAEFFDAVPGANVDLKWLAPVAPKTADFDADFDALTVNIADLSPLTPAEADFE